MSVVAYLFVFFFLSFFFAEKTVLVVRTADRVQNVLESKRKHSRNIRKSTKKEQERRNLKKDIRQ